MAETIAAASTLSPASDSPPLRGDRIVGAAALPWDLFGFFFAPMQRCDACGEVKPYRALVPEVAVTGVLIGWRCR